MAAERQVDYLRISVTDRCNERCLYCLPENFKDWTARDELLTFAEMLAVARVAVRIGFRKFRVTGGEPLLRDGVIDFVGNLIRLPGVGAVSMTTNGTRLGDLAPALYKAGLRSVNVSLDALDAAKYREITHGELGPVLEGIGRALDEGMAVKLNTVLIRGRNEDEIVPLARFAAERGIPVRFIELMPVSLTEMLDESNFLPIAEAKEILGRGDELEVEEARGRGNGPARYFRLKKMGAVVGFIGAMSDFHFCEQCNKVRLTADGKIRPCLGHHNEIDLKAALRPAVDVESLEAMFQEALATKPPEHLFRENYQPGRVMTAIGG